MAHSPKKKAEVMIDLCCGVSTHVAAEKHDVPQSTVAEWALEIKSGQNRSTTEIRKEDFNARLVALLFKGFDVVEAWAEMAADPAFIQSNPEAAHELGKTVLERCDRIVGLVQSSNLTE